MLQQLLFFTRVNTTKLLSLYLFTLVNLICRFSRYIIKFANFHTITLLFRALQTCINMRRRAFVLHNAIQQFFLISFSYPQDSSLYLFAHHDRHSTTSTIIYYFYFRTNFSRGQLLFVTIILTIIKSLLASIF